MRWGVGFSTVPPEQRELVPSLSTHLMPANEREWAREPLPAERIEPEKPKISADDLEDYELFMTADGFDFKRKERVNLGWKDVLFWAVLLVLARAFT